MWIVYLATNRCNGHRYVGITSASLPRRKCYHFWDAFKRQKPFPFAQAIRKYGKDAFVWTVIASAIETEAMALALETHFIAALKPEYNATKGGDLRHINTEQRKAYHRGRTPASYLKGKVEIELPSAVSPEAAPAPGYVEGEVEKWRAVVGFEGFYEVSDHGNVRSCTRDVKHPDGGMMRRRGRPLKPRAMSGGRMFVTLQRHPERLDIGVAVVVATAFVRVPKDGQIVLRRDTDPQNDRASNLFWGTMKDLAAKRSRDGTSLLGERHPLTKLTPEVVREIRALRGKKKQHEIGEMFGVSNSVVSGVQSGRVWSHVR